MHASAVGVKPYLSICLLRIGLTKQKMGLFQVIPPIAFILFLLHSLESHYSGPLKYGHLSIVDTSYLTHGQLYWMYQLKAEHTKECMD